MTIKQSCTTALFLCFTIFNSCIAQSDNLSIDSHKSEILDPVALRTTSDKIIQLIKDNNVIGLKRMFTASISSRVTLPQILALTKKLNQFIKDNGVPEDEYIVPSLKQKTNGSDTIFLNNILYQYKSSAENKISKTLVISFLKRFGTEQIVDIYIEDDFLSSGNAIPEIEKLSNFDFDVNKIKLFSIYYQEAKLQNSKFGNNIGVFRIQGDKEVLKETLILEKISAIFEDLKKSQFEKSDIFNENINTSENTEFIRMEIVFEDKPYGLSLYLPIKNGGVYDNNIILRQMQYANLGYQFYLDKKMYQKLIQNFERIKSMPLEKYYQSNP